MPYPTTRTTLLDRLSGDEAAWTEFFDRYRGEIVDLGRFKGLSADECASPRIDENILTIPASML